jgi:hypothetical protein
MSRAKSILEWAKAIDEETAYDMEHSPNYHLSTSPGYTYQDRGQKDGVVDSAVMSGTHVSGTFAGQGQDKEETATLPAAGTYTYQDRGAKDMVYRGDGKHPAGWTAPAGKSA